MKTRSFFRENILWCHFSSFTFYFICVDCWSRTAEEWSDHTSFDKPSLRCSKSTSNFYCHLILEFRIFLLYFFLLLPLLNYFQLMTSKVKGVKGAEFWHPLKNRVFCEKSQKWIHNKTLSKSYRAFLHVILPNLTIKSQKLGLSFINLS